MKYRLSKRKRSLCFFLGLAISGIGVALSTRPGLGTSPISSLPYVMTFIVPYSLGVWTVFTNALMVLTQILILRRDYHWIQLSQIFAAAIFGFFIDFGMWLSSFCIMENYCLRMAEQILGCGMIAFGIECELIADVTYMPGEGLVKAISSHWHWNFGKVKIGFDLSIVTIAALLSLIYCGQIEGIREGTVVAAVSVGYFVKLLRIPFRRIKRTLLIPIAVISH